MTGIPTNVFYIYVYSWYNSKLERTTFARVFSPPLAGDPRGATQARHPSSLHLADEIQATLTSSFCLTSITSFPCPYQTGTG